MSKWISTKDKLPKQGRRVLGWLPANKYLPARPCVLHLAEDEAGLYWFGDVVRSLAQASYWKPIKPPKED